MSTRSMRIVPELGELAPEDGVLAAPAFDLGPDAVHAHPGGVRPGVLVDLLERGPGEGVLTGRAPAVAMALYAERRSDGRARGKVPVWAALDGARVARAHPSEVITEVHGQRFVVLQAQVLDQQLPGLIESAQPCRYSIRLFEGKGSQHPFFGGHRTIHGHPVLPVAGG